jgi:hypothetical protein
MIPYDELVESLANWRQKNGMTSRNANGGGRAQPGRPADESMDTNTAHAAVPERDFGSNGEDESGEIALDADVLYGEEDDV